MTLKSKEISNLTIFKVLQKQSAKIFLLETIFYAADTRSLGETPTKSPPYSNRIIIFAAICI